MDYTEEQIKSFFEKLPKDVQTAVSSVEVASGLQKVGEKYKLHVDKIDELFDETTLVMLGLTHPKDYLNNLKRRLEIPENLAREMVNDVNEQIFKPIRGSLMKIHEVSKEKEAELAKNENVKFTPAINLADKERTIVETPITAPPADQPTRQDFVGQNLSGQDEKILKDSGIEIQPTTNNLQPTNNEFLKEMPKKAELLSALENPQVMPKGEASMPAGFAMVKRSPEAKIVPPEKKLSEATGSPAVESSYLGKTPPDKQATPALEQKRADPYREPI